MARRLPEPRTPAEAYAAATYERLGELVAAVDVLAVLLRERVQPAEVVGAGGVQVAGPTPPEESVQSEPKPAPGAAVAEPAEPAGPAVAPLPDPPPRAGRGSSLSVWQAWANQAGVTYPDGAGRDDIIAACEQAGVIRVDTARTA